MTSRDSQSGALGPPALPRVSSLKEDLGLGEDVESMRSEKDPQTRGLVPEKTTSVGQPKPEEVEVVRTQSSLSQSQTNIALARVADSMDNDGDEEELDLDLSTLSSPGLVQTQTQSDRMESAQGSTESDADKSKANKTLSSEATDKSGGGTAAFASLSSLELDLSRPPETSPLTIPSVANEGFKEEEEVEGVGSNMETVQRPHTVASDDDLDLTVSLDATDTKLNEGAAKEEPAAADADVKSKVTVAETQETATKVGPDETPKAETKAASDMPSANKPDIPSNLAVDNVERTPVGTKSTTPTAAAPRGSLPRMERSESVRSPALASRRSITGPNSPSNTRSSVNGAPTLNRSSTVNPATVGAVSARRSSIGMGARKSMSGFTPTVIKPPVTPTVAATGAADSSASHSDAESGAASNNEVIPSELRPRKITIDSDMDIIAEGASVEADSELLGDLPSTLPATAGGQTLHTSNSTSSLSALDKGAENRKLTREPSFRARDPNHPPTPQNTAASFNFSNTSTSPSPAAATAGPATSGGGSVEQRLARFKEAADAAEAKLKKAEERNAAAGRREAKLKAEITSHQKRIAELEAELEAQKAKTNEAEDAKAKLQMDLLHLEEKHEETLREVARLNAAVLDVERNFRDAMIRAEDEKRKAEAERERERERERAVRQELEDQLVSANAQKDSLTEKLVQLKRDKHEIANTLAEVESQLRIANETLMARDQSKAEQKINQLNEEITVLKARLGENVMAKVRYQTLLRYVAIASFVREYRARAALVPLYSRLAEISACALREESRGERLGEFDLAGSGSFRTSIIGDPAVAIKTDSNGPSCAVLAAVAASAVPKSVAAGVATAGLSSGRKGSTAGDGFSSNPLISAFARTSTRHQPPWLANPDRRPGPPRCADIVDAIEAEVSTLEACFEMLKLQKRRWQELTGVFFKRNADLAQSLWKAKEELGSAQSKAESADALARECAELKLRLLQLCMIDSKTKQLTEKRLALAAENEALYKKCRIEEFQLLFSKTVHLRRRAAKFAEKLRALMQQQRNLVLASAGSGTRSRHYHSQVQQQQQQQQTQAPPQPREQHSQINQRVDEDGKRSDAPQRTRNETGNPVQDAAVSAEQTARRSTSRHRPASEPGKADAPQSSSASGNSIVAFANDKQLIELARRDKFISGLRSNSVRSQGQAQEQKRSGSPIPRAATTSTNVTSARGSSQPLGDPAGGLPKRSESPSARRPAWDASMRGGGLFETLPGATKPQRLAPPSEVASSQSHGREQGRDQGQPQSSSKSKDEIRIALRHAQLVSDMKRAYGMVVFQDKKASGAAVARKPTSSTSEAPPHNPAQLAPIDVDQQQ